MKISHPTVVALLAAHAATALGAEPRTIIAPQPIHDAIVHSLEVTSYTAQDTEIRAMGEGVHAISLNVQGAVHEFTLEPYSLRSENFKVKVQQDDGSLLEIEAPAPRTVRGTSADGSISVVGSILDDGFTGHMYNEETGETFGVQPLASVTGIRDGRTHIVFNNMDSMPTDRICGGAVVGQHEAQPAPQSDNADITPRAGFNELELIVDVDFDFLQFDAGGNQTNAINIVENVIGIVDVTYQRDSEVLYVINEIFIRASSGANPYSTSNASALLNQVEGEWGPRPEPRDLVHLFTGRNIIGGTIGIANINGVCQSFNGTALSEVGFSSNANSRAALVAHEIGHNFNATHCDSVSPCHIMCSGFGGCNGNFPPGVGGIGFGPSRAGIIQNIATARACIAKINVINDVPVADDFEAGVLDDALWPDVSGASASTSGVNEPSGSFSMNLDNTDTAATPTLALADDFLNKIVLSFSSQARGVENGERLIAEFRDLGGSWVPFFEVISDGTTQSEFVDHVEPLPIFAFTDNFAFRFRADGNAGNDDWYVDDFSLAPFAGISIPFFEDFENGLNTVLVFDTVLGATTSSGADNELSGTESMLMNGSDTVTTANMLLSEVGFADTWVRLYTQTQGVEAGETMELEFRDLFGVWQPLGTITSDGVDQSEFQLNQFQVPIFGGFSDQFAVRISVNGDGGDSWFVEDFAVDGTFIEEPDDACSAADLAEPLGALDFNDVVAFLNAFSAGQPEADLSAPIGVFDFNDVVAFLGIFAAGCP